MSGGHTFYEDMSFHQTSVVSIFLDRKQTQKQMSFILNVLIRSTKNW